MDSLDGGLVEDSSHRDAIEPLHGRHSRLHGLLLTKVRRPQVMREKVAVVLQPRLVEMKRRGEKEKKEKEGRRTRRGRRRINEERLVHRSKTESICDIVGPDLKMTV